MSNPHLFLTGEEFSPTALQHLIDQAIDLKKNRFHSVLNQKTIALLFEKPSLRTRASFSTAITQLGGQVLELNASNSKKEDPADVIRVLKGYVDGLMIRTFSQHTLEKMSEWTVTKERKFPLINGLSDTHHPCQALADLQTLQENFGKLRGLNLTYLGDGNNVLNSLLLLAPVLGVNVRYSCPEGYLPDAKILGRAKDRAASSGSCIEEIKNPKDASIGADALYTDVWTSMGFEEDQNPLKKETFAPFQLNGDLYKSAPSHCLIMHCMPIHEDEEITREMVEHKNSVLFQQSENRLHAQKSLLMEMFS